MSWTAQSDGTRRVSRHRNRWCALATVAVIGSALAVGACSSSEDSSSSAALSAEDERQNGPADANAFDAESGVAGSADLASGQRAETPPLAAPIPAVERQVISTAEVTLRVDNVAETLPPLVSAATSAGGYVAAEDTTMDPDDPSKTRSTLTLRVPTQRLQSLLADVQDLGEVIRSTSDTRDVTEEVVDVDSRVNSARASVGRIRALLSEANTLGEVVRIESQLARREADLESLLARQRTLADQTSLATLTVSVLGPETADAEPAPDDDQGFLAGLSTGWDAFVGALVVGLTVVGVVLPFAAAGLLLLIPAWFFWRSRGIRFTTVHESPPR